jgi:threonine dehydrogenase-like Zn-dependent dehydrogenase
MKEFSENSDVAAVETANTDSKTVSKVDRGTMQAAVFSGPGQVQIQNVPLPAPGPGQIRVRLEGCGLCASNLGPWLGGAGQVYPLAPGAPGHEGWGIVDALGQGVHEPSIGQRVTLLSYNAFAQYDTVPAHAVVPLPAELDGFAFPGESLGCAMNIFRRSQIDPGHTVVIIGIGFLGALLARLCAGLGARVIAVSRRAYALEVARRCGAQICLSARNWPEAAGRIQELTDGHGCQRVIEAVGMQWSLDLGTVVVGERGRFIVAGYHQDGPRQVNMQQWNFRGIDVINAHERDPQVYLQGMREALDAVCADRLNPAPLLTDCFRLDQLPMAFGALQQRPQGFLKAWIKL